MSEFRAIMSPPIERFQKTWKLRMDLLAGIQGAIPENLLPAQHRAFVNMSDILAFCSSPAGIPVCLAHANQDVTPQWVALNLSATQSMQLVNDLISDCFVGSPDEAEQDEQPNNGDAHPSPLPETANAIGP